MSSHANQRAKQLDPNNLLWHHRPPRRLQGEAIRDSLLTLSGRLDTTAFGPPVPIHLTSFMNGRGRPKKSGSLDGDGRRSIYISVRRNFLSPFMLAFDTPTPFSSMGRRNVSNVPAQPLILLNDPLVVELADDWSKQAAKKITGTGLRSRLPNGSNGCTSRHSGAIQPNKKQQHPLRSCLQRHPTTRHMTLMTPVGQN